MGTTLSGLRFPEPVDPVAQGAVAIKNLATDVDPRSRGLLARSVLTGTLDVTTGSNVLTTSVTLTTPRWIRVWALVTGQQITAASTNLNLTVYGNGAAGFRFGVGAVALNETIARVGWHEFHPSAGQFTAYIYATSATTGGALRLAANTVLAIEDIGAQF